jgi:hypothetical protein
MPLLTDEELKAFPEPTTAEVIPNHVARYWDLMALSDRQPAKVIGANGKLRDRPGFEVEFLSRNSIPDTPYTPDQARGADADARPLAADLVRGHDRAEPRRHRRHPAGAGTQPCAPSMTGEASLYRVVATDDPAGLTGRLL